MCLRRRAGPQSHAAPIAPAAFLAGRARSPGGFFADNSLRRARQLAVASLGSGHHAEVAHAPVSFGNEVAAETPQERRAAHGHLLGPPLVTVVFVLEAHRALPLVDALDALVAHRDAAGVTRQVAHHRAGVAEGRAAEDIPIAACEPEPPVAARFQAFKPARPADPGPAVQRFKPPQQDRAEHLRHQTHRKQIVVARLLPTARGAVTPARADQHVQVRMPVERPAPGVEHCQEPALHAPVVFLEELERLGGGPEQFVRRDLIVRFEEFVQLLGDGEHHMEMRAVGQPRAHLLRPFRLPRTQAVRAMAVAARTGKPFLMTATLAARVVVAQRSLAAECHEIQRRILLVAQSPGPEVAPLA